MILRDLPGPLTWGGTGCVHNSKHMRFPSGGVSQKLIVFIVERVKARPLVVRGSIGFSQLLLISSFTYPSPGRDFGKREENTWY